MGWTWPAEAPYQATYLRGLEVGSEDLAMLTLSPYHSEEESWRTPLRETEAQDTKLIPLGILPTAGPFQLSWY